MTVAENSVTENRPDDAPAGCRCQQFGKSGVPYPSGKCMVCGEPVDMTGRIVLASSHTHDAKADGR